jgi:hypothetical protein
MGEHERLGNRGLEPEIALGARDGVLLLAIDPQQDATTRFLCDRYESPGTTDEGETTIGHAHRLVHRLEIKVHSTLGNALGLAEIVERDLLVGLEERLVYVGVLELRTNCVPLAVVLRHVHRVIDEAELLVCNLMLELVSELGAEEHHLFDDIGCCIRNFDRVRLDVHDLEPELLNEVLQVNHEQGSTLRHDVVDVADIPERIVELG